MLDITDLRIRLISDRRDRLRAFACVVVGNALAVRDIKIIENEGHLFVAMPSRRLQDRCPQCGIKNFVQACFCNACGSRLKKDRAGTDERGRPRLYADVAHPIHANARKHLQDVLLAAYQREVEASEEEGYEAAEFDDMDYEE